MQKIRLSNIILFLLLASASFAQKKEVVNSYIATYKELAIAEMKRTGVPAAITLAQGIHESGAGNSKLVLESNNHFGIKCKSNWSGESVKHDDDARGECFRKYPASADSYKDHSDFLKNGQRYAFLFELEQDDYAGWANGLKRAGYATNPKYPQVLIKLIEDYGLQQYTFIAMGKIPDEEPGSAIASVDNGPTEKIIVANEHEKIPTVMPVEKNKADSYPAGEFIINETKVTFIRKGTSFLSIAKQYDIDLSKIFEFNEIARAEIADSDQLVYLQRKRKTGSNEFHWVQSGETLHDIAQQQAIRLESLRELNWLKKEDKPAIGEKLSLKSKSLSMPRLTVKENYSLVPVTKNQGHN
ncbi:MAG: glucosaminidase domain-containing protein [Bacteroidota bacterium]|nr:glucosaminidase domain-containing protein [Bacteroidota bacterium]